MPSDRDKKKRPRDQNALAKNIVDEATEEELANKPLDANKDPKAVKSGRKGGLKGGKARAQKLIPEERSAIARKAALARWRKTRA